MAPLVLKLKKSKKEAIPRVSKVYWVYMDINKRGSKYPPGDCKEF
jgi:hypothetical protein